MSGAITAPVDTRAAAAICDSPCATAASEAAWIFGARCNSNNTGRFQLVRGEWVSRRRSPRERGPEVSVPVQEAESSQAQQSALPATRRFRCYRGLRVPRFVTESERECAEILDYYGVPWEYEPVTFVLETDDDGRVLEAFCPDFYLPDQNLFLEITTMRQELVTRKNRKVRKLRQRYPDVNVKLFYKRDIEALGQKLRSRASSSFAPSPTPVATGLAPLAPVDVRVHREA